MDDPDQIVACPSCLRPAEIATLREISVDVSELFGLSAEQVHLTSQHCARVECAKFRQLLMKKTEAMFVEKVNELKERAQNEFVEETH